MAYILEIDGWIINTKTNPKPFQNQLKNSGKMGITYSISNKSSLAADVWL